MAINTSLTALGKVVLALASDPKVVRHVPYRDSKLTRILSTSLRTQVSILATIHPRVEDYEESLNTLSFADRCKNVARQPQVKYVTASGTQKAKIADLQRQVADLKEKLREVHASRKAAKTDDVDDAIAQALALAAAPSG
ncbi:Kif21b, partial [Symbiodinium necroappetens]